MAMTMEAMAISAECKDQLARRAAFDTEALRKLYVLYYPKLLSYCERRLYILAVAEDVVSEVWLQVAEQVRDFRGTSDREFAGWLYAIATNRTNDYVRSWRRRRGLLEAAAREGRIRMAGQQEPYEPDLDWPHVYAAIAALPVRDQSIVSLRIFEDLPFEQIAAIVGMRPASVRMAYGRTLNKLRVRLGKLLGRM
jgi:RNA polymerase sigma-70 factor, ECF subfamily